MQHSEIHSVPDSEAAENRGQLQMVRGCRLYRSKGRPGLLDLSKSRFFQLRAAGLFPDPDLVLGARTMLWRESTILRWLASRSKEADHVTA